MHSPVIVTASGIALTFEGLRIRHEWHAAEATLAPLPANLTISPKGPTSPAPCALAA